MLSSLNNNENIYVPDRVLWKVDLGLNDNELMSPHIIKRIVKPIYASNVSYKVLPASEVESKFLPIYSQTLLTRPDYRLDPTETKQKIFDISHNTEYKLMWFVYTPSDTRLGGIVLHILPDVIRVAYRVFDHNIAKSVGLYELDYYSELILHRYARNKHYLTLTHGVDKHPLTQLGLSEYKLRIGARPCKAPKAKTMLFKYDPKVLAYYANPIADRYTELHIVNNLSDDAIKSVEKLAMRSGIKLTDDRMFNL